MEQSEMQQKFWSQVSFSKPDLQAHQAHSI